MKRSAIQRRSPLKAKSPSTATVPVLRKKKCAHCGETFTPTRPMQRACNWNCAIAVGQADKAKAERKQDKARKEKLKTRSDYIADAQKVCNAYVRLRDADKPCITCGLGPSAGRLLVGGYWDAGHYRSVGSSPGTRFVLTNLAKQCKRCNRDLAGRAVDFRRNLIARIGLAKVEALEADNEPRKHSVEWLKRFISIFRRKTRRLEKRRGG